MSCHRLRRGAHLAALGCCVLSASWFGMAARADSVNTQTVADAQCMVVGARLSASSSPQQKVPGQMILMYYLGRIDGRSPHADLRSLIEAQTRKMTASDLENAAGRCGKEFSARGEAVVQVGKSLTKPAK